MAAQRKPDTPHDSRPPGRQPAFPFRDYEPGNNSLPEQDHGQRRVADRGDVVPGCGTVSAAAEAPAAPPLHPDLPDSISGRPVTMFYDGGCPLCTREVRHYRRLDRVGAVRWIDINAPDTCLQPYQLTRENAMARLHVLDTDGRMHTGAGAFATLWSVLPGYRWLGRLVRVLHLVPLLEIVYEPFARWRLARRRQNCPL